jgi:hypothetical protein
MNGVDLADQKRASYNTNRRTYRTWIPLWRYLFETAVINAAKAWMDTYSQNSKASAHFKFHTSCAKALMAYGDVQRPLPNRLSTQIIKQFHTKEVLSRYKGVYKVLAKYKGSCVIYKE